jgi:hypothetical protein
MCIHIKLFFNVIGVISLRNVTVFLLSFFKKCKVKQLNRNKEYKYYIYSFVSHVLAVRPARRTDSSAPLSAGAAPPPPPVGMGRGESAAPEFTS